jgi:hypothetical protein
MKTSIPGGSEKEFMTETFLLRSTLYLLAGLGLVSLFVFVALRLEKADPAEPKALPASHFAVGERYLVPVNHDQGEASFTVLDINTVSDGHIVTIRLEGADIPGTHYVPISEWALERSGARLLGHVDMSDDDRECASSRRLRPVVDSPLSEYCESLQKANWKQIRVVVER